MVLVLGGIGTARIARGRADLRPTRVTENEDTSSASAETQRQIQELRGELAMLRLNTATPIEPKNAAATDEKTAPGASMAANSDTAAAQAPPPPDPEADFRLEPVDSAWADTAASHIASTLARTNLKAKTRNTECRSRTCRIEMLEDPSSPVFSQINPLLADDFPTGAMVHAFGPDGKATTTFYYQRRQTP
jgi:hypothetical protein